jgi:hypothetical protein
LASGGWDFDTQAAALDGLRLLGHVAGIGAKDVPPGF